MTKARYYFMVPFSRRSCGTIISSFGKSTGAPTVAFYYTYYLPLGVRKRVLKIMKTMVGAIMILTCVLVQKDLEIRDCKKTKLY